MPKWRHSVSVKEYLSRDESDESALKVLRGTIPQLKKVLEWEQGLSSFDSDRSPEEVTEELEEIIQKFEDLKNEIKKDGDPTDLGFDTYCEALNALLNELYSLGDTPVAHAESFFNRVRFMWVG